MFWYWIINYACWDVPWFSGFPFKSYFGPYRIIIEINFRKKSCYHFFEARLSLKEKVEGHRENAAGGLGASLSIQFPSLPTRLSIYNHEI